MMNADDRRLRREAKYAEALAIIKAIEPEPPEARQLPSDPKPEKKAWHTAITGNDPDAPGFVYFVYCAGRVKIGYATDVAARMSGIATSCPFPVTLLLTITGSMEDEQAYHEMFAEDRANLEWFNLSYFMRGFLEDKFKSGTFELLFQAEFDCKDYFIERATWSKEVFEDFLLS